MRWYRSPEDLSYETFLLNWRRYITSGARYIWWASAEKNPVFMAKLHEVLKKTS